MIAKKLMILLTNGLGITVQRCGIPCRKNIRTAPTIKNFVSQIVSMLVIIEGVCGIRP